MSLNRFLRHQLGRLTFSIGARFYAYMTWQDVWKDHCKSLCEPFPPPKTSGPLAVLDLGIGPGVSGIAIRECRPDVWLVGLDFSAEMLRLARRYLRLSKQSFPLLRADAMNLPFADASFDVLTHHSFLYLLADRDAGLKEMFRVLRPGGSYVILEPNRRGNICVVPSLSGPFRFRLSMFLWRIFSRGFGQFDRDELSGLLQKHGFVCERIDETLGGLGFVVVAHKPQTAHGAWSA